MDINNKLQRDYFKLKSFHKENFTFTPTEYIDTWFANPKALEHKWDRYQTRYQMTNKNFDAPLSPTNFKIIRSKHFRGQIYKSINPETGLPFEQLSLRKKISEYRTEKRHTPEACEKMRQKKLGKKRGPYKKKNKEIEQTITSKDLFDSIKRRTK